MKKFSFSLGKVLSFEEQTLEKEKNLMGRLNAQRLELEDSASECSEGLPGSEETGELKGEKIGGIPLCGSEGAAGDDLRTCCGRIRKAWCFYIKEEVRERR